MVRSLTLWPVCVSRPRSTSGERPCLPVQESTSGERPCLPKQENTSGWETQSRSGTASGERPCLTVTGPRPGSQRPRTSLQAVHLVRDPAFPNKRTHLAGETQARPGTASGERPYLAVTGPRPESTSGERQSISGSTSRQRPCFEVPVSRPWSTSGERPCQPVQESTTEETGSTSGGREGLSCSARAKAMKYIWRETVKIREYI